jgi:DNA-binding response OmpR family regulator
VEVRANDDPHLVALLEATLETEGVDVFTASDGESALRFARERRPTLILLDMHLPGRDGLAVCRSLRADDVEKFADVPVLMLTGSKLAEKDRIDAFRAGATDHLMKPIKPTLVRSRVRGWLLRTAARA